MGTNSDFKDYIAEKFTLIEDMRFKKMFGEYGVFYKEKMVGLICDNQLFIKDTAKGRKVVTNLELAIPYKNAKPHILIEDLENKEMLRDLVLETWPLISYPKSKK
jgi:TfoX/Sxy family transcriptional regulator of competence genes